MSGQLEWLAPHVRYVPVLGHELRISFEAQLVEPGLAGIWRDGEELEALGVAFCGDLFSCN